MPILPGDHVAHVRDLTFHYRRWSPIHPVASLPPIVLVHGLASSSHIWNFVAPLLAECGYEVMAIDQRGHGESAKPDSGYDFSTIIADDHALLTALRIEKPLLVGHSWGAMVALQYATLYPDDVHSLVLVDGATSQFSLREGWTQAKAREVLAPPRFAGTPRSVFVGWMRESPLGQQWTPELEAIMLNIVQLQADGTVAPRLVFENHLQIIDAMWEQPTLDLYKHVQCPLTLIVAMQDAPEPWPGSHKFREDSLRRIRTNCPAATIIMMPDTIHDIPLQRPLALVDHILNTAPVRS